MKTTTQISTLQSTRIAKRLVNHWKHKFDVKETLSDSTPVFQIQLHAALVTLSPQPEFLDVSILSQDASADLEKLESVVLDHLIRMGQEPLEVKWKRDSE